MLKAFTACVLSVALGGCFLSGDVFDLMNRQPQSSQAAFCQVMNQQGGPFLWSSKDTRMTKERADQINAAGKRICGWGAKK